MCFRRCKLPPSAISSLECLNALLLRPTYNDLGPYPGTPLLLQETVAKCAEGVLHQVQEADPAAVLYAVMSEDSPEGAQLRAVRDLHGDVATPALHDISYPVHCHWVHLARLVSVLLVHII